jgi:TRAP transporter TAXI family solute receptor
MANRGFKPSVCALGRAAPAALLAAALCLAAVGLAAGLAVRPAAAQTFFRIGTGSEAGSEFQVGQVLADLLQPVITGEDCAMANCAGAPDLVAAQLSDGALANLADLRDGRLEAALVAAPAAAWAERGAGPFAASGPVSGLAAVAALYPVLLQVVTLERSAIRDIADLRGRRVSLDRPASATEPIARRVLAAYGLEVADIDARYLEPGLALERLAAGRIDAFFALGGVPLEAVARLNAIAEIRLLPVSAARLAEDEALAPVVTPATVPAGAYAELPAVETVATTELLLVRDDLDANLVYEVTARLWAPETLRRLRAVHPLGDAVAIDRALDNLATPLHPGAERFYRERGLLP